MKEALHILLHLCVILEQKILIYGGKYQNSSYVWRVGMGIDLEESLRGDNNVLYLYTGFSYVGVCICQNTSNNTQKDMSKTKE